MVNESELVQNFAVDWVFQLIVITKKAPRGSSEVSYKVFLSRD